MSQAFCPLVLEKLFVGQGTQIGSLFFPQKVPKEGRLQLYMFDNGLLSPEAL